MIENIIKALPDNYGEIQTNFNPGDIKAKNLIGLVIPCYRRPNYLKFFLKSLSESRLENVVICFVDESDAKADLPEFPGYRLFPYMDSPGHDLTRPIIGKKSKLAELKKYCDQESDCLGFNTFGYLKYRIKKVHELKTISHTVCGLYVKENAAKELPIASGPAPDRETALRTVSLLKSFNIESVPILKVFKRSHGQMYESLRAGWDLLKTVFQCDYLCCLDPDTILKNNWLMRLRDVQHKIERTMMHRNNLLTGFNAHQHSVVEKENDYYVKSSVGGINLFFPSATYSILRPALTGIFWDYDFGYRIHLMKGKLFCVRPSVIQHVGRRGVWSDGDAYDFALDFGSGTNQ